MSHSLRFRLLVVLILVVVAAVGGMALISVRVTTKEFQRYENHQGMMRDSRFAGVLAWHYAQNAGWSGVQPEVEHIREITGERLVLADESGHIIADSDGELVGRPVEENWDIPPVQIIHGGRIGLRRSQVISRCEHMRRVETQTHTVRIRPGYDFCQFFEAASDLIALSSSGLQQ